MYEVDWGLLSKRSTGVSSSPRVWGYCRSGPDEVPKIQYIREFVMLSAKIMFGMF